MTPKEYILQRLKQLKNPVNITDSDEPLEERICKLLLSKKFRKYATNPEYLDHIRSAIHLCVSGNEPIKLTLVFGGYKLWRLTETPEVDWAELFSFIYYTNWLKPICQIYPPGVWFDFYSDDVILEIMDNVPRKDTETYLESFRNLLAFMKPYMPKNLSFTLNRVGDQYATYEDFRKELGESIEKVKADLPDGLPTLTPEQARLVGLNVRLNPGQEEDPLWKEKVFLIHEGYSKVSGRRPYYRTPEKVFVITKQMKDSIAVGTTKTSVVKFWIGVGALRKERSDGFMEYIVSPKQLESVLFTKVPIQIDGLGSKNFRTIRLFK